jgi:hypothetical protein
MYSIRKDVCFCQRLAQLLAWFERARLCQRKSGGIVGLQDRYGEPRNDMTVWKIVIGVAIGSVIGGMVLYAIDRYMTQHAITQALESFGQTMRGINHATEREQAAKQRQGAAEEAARALQDQRDRQALADQQRSAEAARRLAQEAAERKERAWAKYYKKPPQCDGDPNSETMMACANQFIRAKREFEEAYAAGKL